jgi:hypothetical protein
VRNKDQILIFAEDPGAVNCLMDLPQEVSKYDVAATILADGLAKERFLQSGIRFSDINSEDARRAISSLSDYSAIIVGTSENKRSEAFKLTALAKSKNIPSIAVVDASMNSGNRFRGETDNPLEHLTDYLFVPDEWTRLKYKDLGIEDERIMITGHPHYVKVLNRANLLDKEGQLSVRKRIFGNKDKRIVVYVSEGSERLGCWDTHRYCEDYTLHGWGESKGRTEIVLEEVIHALKNVRDDIFFVMRLHPKDGRHDFDAYKNDIDYFSIDENPLELVYSSDLVLGSTSMLLTEASILGRKVLSIVPKPSEREWLPAVREGVVKCVYTREDLNGILRTYLYSKELNCCSLTHEKANPVGRMANFICDAIVRRRDE